MAHMTYEPTPPENSQTPARSTRAEITQMLLDASWGPQKLQEMISVPYRWPRLDMTRGLTANADTAWKSGENTLAVPTGEPSDAHPAGSDKSMAMAKIVADIVSRNAPTNVENA